MKLLKKFAFCELRKIIIVLLVIFTAYSILPTYKPQSDDILGINSIYP
jgi:hypothetical protein